MAFRDREPSVGPSGLIVRRRVEWLDDLRVFEPAGEVDASSGKLAEPANRTWRPPGNQARGRADQETLSGGSSDATAKPAETAFGRFRLVGWTVIDTKPPGDKQIITTTQTAAGNLWVSRQPGPHVLRESGLDQGASRIFGYVRPPRFAGWTSGLWAASSSANGL